MEQKNPFEVCKLAARYDEFGNKSSYQKNTYPNLPTQKIPKLKILNPQKSFDHPIHLKSGVLPLPPELKRQKVLKYVSYCELEE